MEHEKSQNKKPELIVMLTQNDFTVMNAAEIFEQCKNTNAQFWGFKEHPLPLEQMKSLYREMKSCGKTTFLEVVAYSETEGLKGAEMAADCGCDILMGTCFYDSINEFCKQHSIKYMPFVGHIEGRPSVLSGDADKMIKQAKDYIQKGAFGIDLLAYRFTGNPVDLCQKFLKEIDAPVCMAGSIDSFKKLQEVKQLSPWTFTIGSAFFENKFGSTFSEQINRVCDFINSNNQVVDYYDSIAEDYDESRFNNSYGKFIDAQERKILNKLINTSESSSRLEIACGTGRLTNYATHGLDASSEMMKHAEKLYPDVKFKLASATDTGYPDNSFDIIYSFHFFMHIDVNTIRNIIDEVYRILKPGGRFIFDIPSKKRRNFLKHKQKTWHGATEFSNTELKTLVQNRFTIKSSHGIMMLPVHKLPTRLRKPLQNFDYVLANSCLKSYSSYLVYELVKI